ncbi:MAG: flagellar hook protein FlgE [Phycisphaeraceae bacterium]
MALTSAIYTGLSGLDANSQIISVAGNNIANVNTTAFKGSRASFETQISRTLSNGSGPSATSGGTNPAQVGLGTQLAAIERDFTTGSLQPSGKSTDMALDGNGFFVVEDNGARRYTRAGNFGLDRDYNLVTNSGARVQGYLADENFNLVGGALEDVSIPIGVSTVAEATSEVKMSGNLNAGGDIATQGSILQSDPMYADAGATTLATAGTDLDSLYDASGNAMFATGDVITVTGATRGGSSLPDYTFEVGGSNTTDSDSWGTTLEDFADFFDDIYGIDNSVSGGTSVSGGQLTIEGNSGTANALGLESSNIRVNAGSATPTTPMNFSETQAADGESTRTTFVAYDSLGNSMDVDVSMVLENKDDSGTTWRFYANSADDTSLDSLIGGGTLSFDTEGQLVSTTGTELMIDRAGTGALTPQTVELAFADPHGSISALVDTKSQFSAFSQNGSQLGTLEDFNVSEDGRISGIFSNGLERTLGQLPVATFSNQEGLEEAGGSMFRETAASGTAKIVDATTGGSGRVMGRALEQSNVDLAEEFTHLITASTGYSANSRVLTTSNQLMQELLNVVR